MASSSRSVVSWKEGDILYLKRWDNDCSDAYSKAGVPKRATDHPAVLLYRKSPTSDHVVVALMTSLGGQTLAEHRFAQSNLERRCAYVPIEPSAPNPDNQLMLTMVPKPCVKRSYINTGEIFILPGALLRRFGDREGHAYSLSRRSLRRLLDFLQSDRVYNTAKSVAAAKDKLQTDSFYASSQSRGILGDVQAAANSTLASARLVSPVPTASANEISTDTIPTGSSGAVCHVPKRASLPIVSAKGGTRWPDIPGSYSANDAAYNPVFEQHIQYDAAGHEHRRPPISTPDLESGASEITPLLEHNGSGNQGPISLSRIACMLFVVGAVSVFAYRIVRGS